MSWYLAVLKKYAEFSGRARRTEYWMFVLFNCIFGFVAAILDSIMGGAGWGRGPISIIYMLAMILPGLAVSVRRLHDVGKSGWFVLVSLIPIIGYIWLLVLLCGDSQQESNQYGENPKEEQPKVSTENTQ